MKARRENAMTACKKAIKVDRMIKKVSWKALDGHSSNKIISQ